MRKGLCDEHAVEGIAMMPGERCDQQGGVFAEREFSDVMANTVPWNVGFRGFGEVEFPDTAFDRDFRC